MTAVETPAAVAWAALVDPEHPQAPGMVVDWLREQLDTDDLAQVRAALLYAAACWVFAVRPSPPQHASISPTTRDIVAGKWEGLRDRAASLRGYYPDGSWDAWSGRLETVATLGPVLEGLTA